MISKFTSKTYIKVRGSEIVVIEPVIISTADATELLIDRGTLWKAFAKQAITKKIYICLFMISKRIINFLIFRNIPLANFYEAVKLMLFLEWYQSLPIMKLT